MPHPDDSPLAEKKDWAVYQGPHGCLHVQLDYLTLTFSTERFGLIELLGEAYVRLGVRETVRQIRPH